MRTLSRPMFNMGGPIKQGIMNGIREPHVKGQIVGKLAPMASKIFGRIKNIFGSTAPKNIDIGQKIKWRHPVTGHSKGYTGVAKPGGWERGAPITETQNIFTPKPWAAATGKYLAGSPEGKAVQWVWSGKGWVPKIAKGAVKSPLIAAGLTYTGVKWIWPDGTEATDTEVKNIQKPGGYPEGKGKGTGTDNAAAFAKSQRDTRVKKYLDMMGYDQSKKLAIADALIDASKIVGDRGTLDKKNITQELINPIIQATSKRLDKPQQIREAVGLMMTKAGLEKEMYDAKPGTVLKNVQDMVKSGQYTEKEAWAIATKEPRGPSDVITSHMASKRGSLDAEDLAIIMRDYGAKNDVPVGVISKSDIIKEYGEGLKEYPTAMEIITDKKITDDGIYVIGKEVIQITGGKPLQLA